MTTVYRRVAFKAFSAFLALLCSILLGFVLPRALGPQTYGEYAFIFATVLVAVEVLTAQTSIGYVHLLSRVGAKIGAVNLLYGGYLFVAATLLVVLVLLSLWNEAVYEVFWGKLSDSRYVYWALSIAVVGLLIKMVTDYADAMRETMLSESGRIANNIVLALGILIWFWTADAFLLEDFYGIYLLSLVPFCLLAMVRLRLPLGPREGLTEVAAEFVQYLKPLMVLAIVGAISAYAGRYAVQYNHSLAEFAYFALALAIVTIPVTVISSIASIYIAEMTRQHDIGNTDGIRSHFLSGCERVFALHACYGVFLLINAEAIVITLVGAAYLPAVPVIQVLVFFSLANSVSVLSSNIFFSTGRMQDFTRVSLAFVVAALIAYLGGLGWYDIGAFELGAIMTGFLLVRVVILLGMNARYLEFSLARFLGRGIVILVVISVGLVAISLVVPNLWWNFVVSCLLLATLNFAFGDVVGVTRLYKDRTVTDG